MAAQLAAKDLTIKRSKIFLLLPAYNPGKKVIQVVSQALPLVDEIVIVDDGCDEAERAYLHKCSASDKVTLLKHDANMGKGVALHTGMNHCLSKMRESDFILTMDSDGQHDPADISKFRELLNQEDLHFALGERLDDGKMPFKSRLGNGFMRFLFRAQFGGKVHDTQTGFRLLSAEFARNFAARVNSGRFESEMDMLILAARTLPTIHSVQISTIYFDKNKGTKFKALLDSYSILKLFLKYGAVSIASFVVDYLVFIALTYLAGIPYLASNALARFVSAVFNFSGHKGFSFRSKGRLVGEVMKYLLAVAAALALATVLLYLCVAGLDVPKYLAKPLVDAAVFVINFVVLSRFVFRGRLSA